MAKSDMHRQLGNAAELILTAVAMLMVAAIVGWSQTAPLPNEELERRAKKSTTVTLERGGKEVADECIDLLEQLRDVTHDYQQYFSQYSAPIIARYRPQLGQLSMNLDSGLYASNSELLRADLEKNIAELTKIEKHIRESEEVYPIKLYRLVRSLKRELVSMNSTVSDELCVRFAEFGVNLSQISQVIRKTLAGFEVRTATNADGSTVYTFVTNGGTPKAKVRGNLVFRGGDRSDDEIPSVIVKLPEIPPVERVTFEEGSGSSKTLNASITADNPKAPILITSNLGSIIVSPNDEDQITAELSIEVSADSRLIEKSLLAETELDVTKSSDGYVVTAKLPQRKGQETRVLRSTLTVSVPPVNHVRVNGSFGDVSVDGIQGGLEVKCSYCQISLGEIKGAVTASNTFGKIALSNIAGPLTVKNSYGPIEISECDGKTDVLNAYASIEISSSQGDLKLRNSGAISIEQHVGDIDIENTFGGVEISNVRGDISATNGFAPIEIRDVRGSATLSNANSRMGVTDITGSLKASNKFGQIEAEGVRGPFMISNLNGSVNLIIREPLRGSSSINTSFGSVNVSVPEDGNLFLTARTVYGDIRSFLPLAITDLGESKSSVYKMGRGSDSLSIVGSNASIFIDRSN